MSGKYIKTKKIIVSAFTLMLIASQIVGCGVASKDQAKNALNNNSTIELEVNSDGETEDQTDVNPFLDCKEGQENHNSELAWIELGNLKTCSKLREAWKKYFLTEETTDGKMEGPMYIVAKDGKKDVYSNNATLLTASKNYRTHVTFSQKIEALTAEAEELNMVKHPNDVDEYGYTSSLSNQAALAGIINEYFNLLPTDDSASGKTKPNRISEKSLQKQLTRAEAMTILTRAVYPVDSSLQVSSEFEKQVGKSKYNLYAQKVNDYCYVNTTNGLDKDTYNKPMSRLEAVYMVGHLLFPDGYDEFMKKFGDKAYDTYYDAVSIYEHGTPQILRTGKVKETREHMEYAKSVDMSSEKNHAKIIEKIKESKNHEVDKELLSYWNSCGSHFVGDEDNNNIVGPFAMYIVNNKSTSLDKQQMSSKNWWAEPMELAEMIGVVFEACKNTEVIPYTSYCEEAAPPTLAVKNDVEYQKKAAQEAMDAYNALLAPKVWARRDRWGKDGMKFRFFMSSQQGYNKAGDGITGWSNVCTSPYYYDYNPDNLVKAKTTKGWAVIYDVERKEIFWDRMVFPTGKQVDYGNYKDADLDDTSKWIQGYSSDMGCSVLLLSYDMLVKRFGDIDESSFSKKDLGKMTNVIFPYGLYENSNNKPSTLQKVENKPAEDLWSKWSKENTKEYKKTVYKESFM